MDHPAIDRVHLVKAFRRRNKCHGRNDLAVFTAHAQEDFVVVRIAFLGAAQRQNGLAIKNETIFLERMSDTRHPFHVADARNARGIVLIKNINAIAAQILGGVTGGIGLTQ